jgi:methylated-DNA-[protein]-cysteine S-methyltransferase
VRIDLSQLESPLGTITIAYGESGLCALEFDETGARVRGHVGRAHPDADVATRSKGGEIAERLVSYFGGEFDALDAIRVDAAGTLFQKAVWKALRRIPVGETTSYCEIAARVGRPRAVRAVGAANGRNPIALVVPCHRVIASDGTLCGYAGGLWRKEWLLRHEGFLGERQPRAAGTRA